MEAITLGMATVIVFGFLPCNSILNTLSSLSEQPQMFLKNFAGTHRDKNSRRINLSSSPFKGYD